MQQDFRKFMKKDFVPGGGVAKTIHKCSEALNSQIPDPGSNFTGGTIPEDGFLNTVDSTKASQDVGSSQPTQKKSKVVDPVVVATLLIVGGLITLGAIAILREREMYSSHNNIKSKQNANKH